MMMDVRNLPWIGAGLTVVAAADASLIGRQGHVIGETRNTIHLLAVSYTHLTLPTTRHG